MVHIVDKPTASDARIEARPERSAVRVGDRLWFEPLFSISRHGGARGFELEVERVGRMRVYARVGVFRREAGFDLGDLAKGVGAYADYGSRARAIITHILTAGRGA